MISSPSTTPVEGIRQPPVHHLDVGFLVERGDDHASVRVVVSSPSHHTRLPSLAGRPIDPNQEGPVLFDHDLSSRRDRLQIRGCKALPLQRTDRDQIGPGLRGELSDDRGVAAGVEAVDQTPATVGLYRDLGPRHTSSWFAHPRKVGTPEAAESRPNSV